MTPDDNDIWLPAEKVGELIADIMQRLGMTKQAELAEALGSPGAQANVSRWVTGARRPDPTTMARIARLVNEPVTLFQRVSAGGGGAGVGHVCPEVMQHVGHDANGNAPRSDLRSEALALLQRDEKRADDLVAAQRDIAAAFRERCSAIRELLAQPAEEARPRLKRRGPGTVRAERRARSSEETPPPVEPSPMQRQAEEDRDRER